MIRTWFWGGYYTILYQFQETQTGRLTSASSAPARCVEAGSVFRAQSAEVQLRAEVEELFREVLESPQTQSS